MIAQPRRAGGGLYVRGADLRDAFGVDTRDGEEPSGYERGKDDEFARRVEPLDIRARIALGVAAFLRVCKRVGKGGSVGEHLGQDIVGRSVEDAAHLGDLVLPEHRDDRREDRDSAADRRFKAVGNALLARNAQTFVSERGDDLFVRADDALARAKRAEGVLVSGVRAAHRLDHDRDCGIALDIGKIVGNEIGVGGSREVAQVEDARELDALAGQAEDFGGILREQVRASTPDDAESDDGNLFHIRVQFLIVGLVIQRFDEPNIVQIEGNRE